ncbi:anaerobic ribonucleoside-triphosphate reductase [Klebsiella phage vB_Kpn_3]|nr:anaerobic ribonucleoside-triphosphate reductase [Klebsiella phage vB_Kpn_3]
MDQKKEETKLGYSLYATPSESLCDRFNSKIPEYFPEHDCLKDKGYYTNSHHLDVGTKVAPNVKFDYESNFTPIASGGCISYVELPDMKRFPMHWNGLLTMLLVRFITSVLILQWILVVNVDSWVKL